MKRLSYLMFIFLAFFSCQKNLSIPDFLAGKWRWVKSDFYTYWQSGPVQYPVASAPSGGNFEMQITSDARIRFISSGSDEECYKVFSIETTSAYGDFLARSALYYLIRTTSRKYNDQGIQLGFPGNQNDTLVVVDYFPKSQFSDPKLGGYYYNFFVKE